MEEGIPRKEIEISSEFYESYENIYDFGVEKFGQNQAIRYAQQIRNYLSLLSTHYLIHPECRHIPTKSRKYRNIILDSHLIIYRITALNIEVLTILHSALSPGKIRGARRIRIIK